MQKKMAMRPRESSIEWDNAPLENGRTVHKRMERWLRLQQFVYGLSADYSYAVRMTNQSGGNESHVLVKLGWINWYGKGCGANALQALGVALLETVEAVSANSTAVFLHNLLKFVGVNRYRRKVVGLVPAETMEERELLAG